MLKTLIAILFLVMSAAPNLHADVAMLLAEPYGHFGGLSPTGHSAVYLNRICADTPTRLRTCVPGEYGVVISRYSNVAGYDWLAIPLLPFLYAVERSEHVPDTADAKTVAFLRDSYRRRHLRDLVPDSSAGEIPDGGWYQLIGAAYDRKIYAFQLETTAAQDEAFIRQFNSRRNKARFNLLFRNCADFTREVVNSYYPKALRRSIIADAGITTPKHLAKSMVRYSKKHPELQFHVFAIEQIPGSRPPSRRTRGVFEALVRSKKYAVPLVAVNVWLAPAFMVGYVTGGRFKPEHFVQHVYAPPELEDRALAATKDLPPRQDANDDRINSTAQVQQPDRTPADTASHSAHSATFEGANP